MKKLKRPSQLDLRGSVEPSPAPTVPSTPVMDHSRPSFPLDTHQIYDSLFETPFHPSDESLIKSYANSTGSDQLSPIPIARRMLSRTSSRNLKENPRSLSHSTSRQGLASPFASRPASRTASPLHTSKSLGKRPMHAKSRTLSSSFNKLQTSQPPKPTSATRPEDSIFDSIFSSTIPGSATGSITHSRSGSIPILPSNLLDHIPAQDWLVPAKALSRSPPSLEDMQLDGLATDHASFYLDEPAKISTPPRRRRTTVTLHNYRPSIAPVDHPDLDGSAKISAPRRRRTTVTLQNYRDSIVPIDQSDSVPMDMTDVVAAEQSSSISSSSEMEMDSGPPRARRRRRTVVHMSSDSIFSSALDFSAYMTEFSPTKVHGNVNAAPAQPTSPPGLVHPGALSSAGTPAALDPAFSPAAAAVPMERQASAPAPGSPAEQPVVTRTVPPTPEISRPSLSRRTQSLPSPLATARDELPDMFTALGIQGTYQTHICASFEVDVLLDTPDDVPPDADDSGVGLEKTIAEILPASSASRTTHHTHRRDRAGTIRASDFARPVLTSESASSGPSNPRMENRKAAAPATRRTRSGTVTLANAHAKPPAKGKAKTARRAGKLPTIPMKIDDEPLPPQGSDEEDDELLLRRGVYWVDD